MSTLSGIKRIKVRAILVLICTALIFQGCIDPKPSDDQKVIYRLNVITAKAKQEFPGNEVYGGQSLDPIYQNWVTFTKNGSSNSSYINEACQGFLSSLQTFEDADTTTYVINSNRLDGPVGCTYYVDNVIQTRSYSSLKLFAIYVKQHAIERHGLVGKAICMICAAQYEPSLLMVVTEPRWDNMPQEVYLGEMWPARDANGEISPCTYNNELPTGLVFTVTISVMELFVQEKLIYLGVYDETDTRWANKPPGEFSYTKWVHSTFAHEVAHQLGYYWGHHPANDQETACCMRGAIYTDLTAWNWEDKLRKSILAVCYCQTCASNFCPLSTYEE